MDGVGPLLCVFWAGIATVAFARGHRPTAVLAIYILGQLFLPEVQSSPVGPNKAQPFRVPMLEFTKLNSMSYGLMLGMLLFDPQRLGRIRWSRHDLPGLLMPCFPSFASLINGQRFDDAFAEFRNGIALWGIPYVLGRAYLSDATGCRRAVTAIALGGLLYMPFCLVETRLSPVLHSTVYGFQQHAFIQTKRWGGYRPMVFMQHGIAVAFWMVAATVALFWLWWSNAWDPPKRFALAKRMAGAALAGLAVTTVFCKSLGAIALGFAGAGMLFISDRLKFRWAFLALIAVAPMYVALRAPGKFKTDDVISLISSQVHQERADSLEFRLMEEDRFLAEMTNPLTGMGGTPTKRPKNEEGKLVIVDGLWLIVYFESGIPGITVLLSLFLLPALRFVLIHPAHTWTWPEVAPAAAAAAIATVYAIDCLFNAMFNPVYTVMIAALVGWNDIAAQHKDHLQIRR